MLAIELAEINWTAILGAGSLGVIVSAVVSYALAARRMSGKISTTDAQDLWKEAHDIREDYRERLIASEQRTLALETRVAKLEGDNNNLVRENIALRDEVNALKVLVSTLRDTITGLEAELKEAKQDE